jgi:hypothetical protein
MRRPWPARGCRAKKKQTNKCLPSGDKIRQTCLHLFILTDSRSLWPRDLNFGSAAAQFLVIAGSYSDEDIDVCLFECFVCVVR